MENLLKEIISKLDSLNNKVSNLDNKVNDLKEGQVRIENKLDYIYEQTTDLTEFRTLTSDNLNEINKNISFMKHKLHQNEEEIFDIKNCIKLVK